jgi:NAD(P)-dependent dehydrogenase (short-subunit alcohol dehydrogenase family)
MTVADRGTVVVIGGTSDIGKSVAAHYASQGTPVVVTSRELGRAEQAAREVGPTCRGLVVDLSEPQTIADALRTVNDVSYLVLVAVERDDNHVRDYNLDSARTLVTLKILGYTEVIHVLVPRMRKDASVVLFGGLAKDRPYPGSLTVTSVNGAVSAMVRTLAIELAPIRVNAIHPGIVGDSAFWRGKAAALERTVSRTPTGRLVTVADVAGATAFLLENQGVNGVNLQVDGGWMVM